MGDLGERASAVSPSPPGIDGASSTQAPRRSIDRGRVFGIGAGLLLLAVACFWTRLPADYIIDSQMPPARASAPHPSATPTTPIAISMLHAHFRVSEGGHHITWSVQNVGRREITGLYLTLFDQRYADRTVDFISQGVLSPGQSAAHGCDWYNGPPAIRVDSGSVVTDVHDPSADTSDN